MKIYPLILCSLIASSTVFAESDSASSTSSTKEHGLVRQAPSQAGVRVGLSKVEQLGDPVATFGVYTDYALSDNLLAGGAVDYWDKSSGTIAETSVRASDLAVALDLKYIFTRVTQSFRPYLVAGAVAHRFEIRAKSNQTKPLESKYREAVGKFGLDYGGGVSYRFDKAIDAVGEIRYRNIMDSSVALSQLSFTGGLNYVM